ncbi:hypothetical protein EON65_11865 [archaeon]|nr:MAG: hypothetical protein EON65_11865 [archaeon]
MDSPIKGLERLSEELKIERQKLNIALQERARVRVEVESHKQIIEQQKSEIQEYSEIINSLKDELQQTNNRADVLQNNYDSLQEEASQRENQYQSWLQSSQDQSQSAVAYEEQLQAKDEEIKSLQILIETMDTKAGAKDELIATLKDELLDLRRLNANNEQEKLEAYRYLSELDATNQDLSIKLHLADVSTHGLQERQSATEELRSELEASLQLNTSLNEQVRELNEKLQSKYLSERKLNEVVSQSQSDKESIKRECDELRSQVQSLLSAVRTENETKAALAEKNASIMKNRDFLDDQVEELRETVQTMQRNTLQLEEEIDQYKERLEEAYGELQAKDRHIEELSMKAHKADEMSPMLVEVDSLRTQLNALRKQMIRRDLEDQAGILPTRVLLDREQQGRSVYEGIIADLRAEVERLTVKHDDVMGRYERAMERASKVELLEEELSIYKEMAQNMSRETQT